MMYSRWQPNNHHQAPMCIRSVIETMMLIRVVEHRPLSILIHIPNELMFEIFARIDWLDRSSDVDLDWYH
jgi:hypothetical protein